MSKVFILGAGFSKAFSYHMPTMLELSEYIRRRIAELPTGGQNHAVYEKLISMSGGLENLLTYLFEATPWKNHKESYIDKAALMHLLDLIGDRIVDCEERAFENEDNFLPWTRKFTEHLYDENVTVATLNYDTVIERLSGYYKGWGGASGMYVGMPMLMIQQRSMGMALRPPSTYCLLKLHGSTNFYFAGDENTPSQPVYYIKANSKSPKSDRREPHVARNMVGMIPLVIPPLSQKNIFYNLFVNLIVHLKEYYV